LLTNDVVRRFIRGLSAFRYGDAFLLPSLTETTRHSELKFLSSLDDIPLLFPSRDERESVTEQKLYNKDVYHFHSRLIHMHHLTLSILLVLSLEEVLFPFNPFPTKLK